MAYVQTTTHEQVTINTRWCAPDQLFLRSPPGILKIIELVVDVIIWICVGSARYFAVTGNGGYINFAATITFVVTMILFVLYLFQLIHRLPGPWILIESVSLLLSVFFLAVGLVVGAFSHAHGGGAIAAAVFCALNAVVYGVEMFLRFRLTRSDGCTITATAVEGDIAIRQTTVRTESATGAPDDHAGRHGEFGEP